MKRICFLGALLIFTWGFVAPTVKGQYILPEQRRALEAAKDSAAKATPDTTQAVDNTDSTKAAAADTTRRVVRPSPTAEAAEPAASPQVLVSRAHTWLLRLLYRGQLDASHIGAYSRYQLTAWDEVSGSYGPVLARLAVYYLGPTEWQGKDAEWLQAVYETMENNPQQIEYDLIVGRTAEGLQIYRALYRVDWDELQPLEPAAVTQLARVDAGDRPMDAGKAEVELHSGTFDTDKFIGSGLSGEEVVMYRDADVKPLGLVRLGYGDQALTLIDNGSDARPRFYVPPPPRTE